MVLNYNQNALRESEDDWGTFTSASFIETKNLHQRELLTKNLKTVLGDLWFKPTKR